MRNALAHVPKGQHGMVAAALRQTFPQADQAAARQARRQLADQLRPPSAASWPRLLRRSDDPPPGGSWPKLAGLMDDSGHDPPVPLRGPEGRLKLACMAFPAQHRTKLHSTNPLERLNKEVKRRADAVGIFPGETSIIRPIGAVLLEANPPVKPEGRLRQLQHRYMQVEAMAELMAPEPQTLRLPPLAA